MQRFFFTIVSLLSITTDAKLRGMTQSMEGLKQRATNPQLSDAIRGKTLAELGVPQTSDAEVENDRSLSLFDGRIFRFFAIYDEIGPNIKNLGETAGINGLIYDQSKYAAGMLTDEDVIGALKASCSVVGSKNDQFCTFEILLGEKGQPGFGTVIASGGAEFTQGEGGLLIVEAAGDDFAEFVGGIFTLTYDLIGKQVVVSAELALSR